MITRGDRFSLNLARKFDIEMKKLSVLPRLYVVEVGHFCVEINGAFSGGWERKCRKGSVV